MTATDQGQHDVVRFFTRVRRVPVLLGKLNGWKIPGGPYTLTQLGIGSIVLVVGWNTRLLWGSLTGATPLIQLGLLVALAAGATWAAGRIPQTNRKLPDLVRDMYGAFTVPASGRYKGTLVRLPRPHQVTGEVLIRWEDDSIPAGTVQPTTIAAPAAIVRPPAVPASIGAPSPVAPRTPPEPAALPAVAVAVTAEPEPESLPDNVIPIRRAHATGLERLLEQARRKESDS